MFQARARRGFRNLRSLQGGWTAFIYFIVTLVLTVALSPKPPKPKPASLEDFDIPVAEEDRPIPVLFGTKRITGANVVWYGNLRTTKIKKKSLMGSQTVGYKYYLGMHMALGHGPFDAITKIETADKEAWTGNITANGDAAINMPDLYGGKEREGGIVGTATILMGRPDQAVNSYLAAQQGSPTPAYRGVTSIVWHDGTVGGYIGNTPYVKAWAVTCRRILKGWQNDDPWYPTKAVIGHGMNGAHIIYQCLTDKEWGQGSPSIAIDTDSFEAAADQLFDENFGLNLLWNQATKIEDFIQIVCDHIGALLAFDESTGKYLLKLIRGDYDPDTLETFGPETISEVTNFERRSWGETVNELVITWTDADTGKPTAIVVQDLGNIVSQADTRIAEKLDFSGIDDPDVMNVVAGRELAARSTPLCRMDIRANRKLWRYGPGDVFKAFWPQHNLGVTVFRVLNMGRGTHADGKMTVNLVEDIYALAGIEYVAQQPAPPVIVPPIDTPDPDSGSTNVLSHTTNVPPSNPSDGDRYFIPTTPAPTGAWVGHGGEIAEWDDDENTWLFFEVPEGTVIYDETDQEYFGVDEYGGVTPPPWGSGGGGAIIVVDEDATPDEVIDPVSTVFIKGAEVQDMGTGGLRIVVSPATTQGDIATRTNTGGYARQPAGADGTVLSYDSSQATGLRAIHPPVGAPASAARVSRDSDQAIPSGALTAIEWTDEAFDTDGYWTPTTPERFTVSMVGKYLVSCNIAWDLGTDQGNRLLVIRLNGVEIVAAVENEATGSMSQHVSTVLDLIEDDYVEFLVRSTAPGGVELSPQMGQPHATISRVGNLASPTQMRGATFTRAAGAIAVPVNPVFIRCPVAGRITSISIGTVGGPGSCLIDVTRTPHSAFPPDSPGDSIVGTSPPSISAGTKYEDTALNTWDVEVNEGDWLGIHLESCSTFTSVFVQLFIQEAS